MRERESHPAEESLASTNNATTLTPLTPSAVMAKNCIVCRAVASPNVQLQYCDACQSACYCSRACQRIDWKKQHRKICKLLNVGHGDMQVRDDIHTERSNELRETFERSERTLPGIYKRRKSSRGAKDEEICQTTAQKLPEVSIVLQFVLSCSIRFGDAVVGKQSTSCVDPVRRSQHAVRR
jgi:hypothetical protein